MSDNTKFPRKGRNGASAGSGSPALQQRKARMFAFAIVASFSIGLVGCAPATAPDGSSDPIQADALASLKPPTYGVKVPPETGEPTTGSSGSSANDATEKASKDPSKKSPKKASKDVKPEVSATPADPKTVPSTPVSPSVAADASLAEVEQPVAKPVPMDEKATTESFDVSVQKLVAIQGEAQGIGEVAGPAIRFVLTVRNNSERALMLNNAVVTVDYGKDSVPATQLSQSGAKEFPSKVEVGKSSSGTFVFQLPAKERGDVRILFNHSAGEQVAAFEGSIPTGKV